MILLILAIVLLLMVPLYAMISSYINDGFYSDGLGERIGMSFVNGLFTLGLSAIAYTILSLCIICNSPFQTITYTQPIVSLKSSSTVSGSFCLGSGTIKEKDYYFYYADLDNNQYKMEKVEAYNTIIQETNERSPQIIITIDRRNPPKWVGKNWMDIQDTKSIIIYVPVGTIIRQIKLE